MWRGYDSTLVINGCDTVTMREDKDDVEYV